ncbi:hypothetical protein L493_1530 [Bordetella bronchiseptica 99-R-0433]|nr:hypothetical protein L493_1530 [Bordetella bronchiseptica 99-R-0433]
MPESKAENGLERGSAQVEFIASHLPGSGCAARARTSVESECQPARAAHGGPAGYGLRRRGRVSRDAARRGLRPNGAAGSRAERRCAVRAWGASG